MKAQKLGLVLGMNMAVACMMMQGCKANKAGNEPLPADTAVVAVAPETKQASATVTPSATATVAATSEIETVPGGVVIEPGPTGTGAATTAPVVSSGAPTVTAPSKVATVKSLPPVGKPGTAPKAAAGTGSTAAGAVPTATAGAAAPAAEGFVYTVKNGDQLFAVSRRYNVKMSAIQKSNPGLNPDKIKIGQKIVIPGVATPTAVATAPVAKDGAVMQASATTVVPAAGAAPTAANTVAPVKTKPAFTPYVGPTKEYVVKSGDSLGKIAYENGITIRALKELNQLTKDSVRIGQKLQIPAEKVVAAKPAAPAKAADAVKVETKPVAAPVVKAQPAKAPAVPAVEKKADEKPAVKDEPVVEAAKPADVKADASAAQEEAPVKVDEPVLDAAPAAPAAGSTYTVKEGDDLVSVSIAYGISPSQLMDLNGLKAGDAIKAGQVLKIPANAKPTEE